jgi:Ca2+/Na+ antiporter
MPLSKEVKSHKLIPRENAFFQYGWVILCMLCCCCVYVHAVNKKKQVVEELQHQMSALQSEKQILLEEKKDLKLQIDSQKDPAWIELTLMKGLGLVPEGQLKVYFTKDE